MVPTELRMDPFYIKVLKVRLNFHNQFYHQSDWFRNTVICILLFYIEVIRNLIEFKDLGLEPANGKMF